MTDEMGRVELPSVRSGAVLAAGHGFRGEMSWTGPIDGIQRLAMRPEVELVVRVARDDGGGPGVPVAIIESDREGRVRMTSFTDASGEAFLTSAGKALSKQASAQG